MTLSKTNGELQGCKIMNLGVNHFKHTPKAYIRHMVPTPNYDPFLKSDSPHKVLLELHVIWTWESRVDSEQTYYQQFQKIIDYLYGVQTLCAKMLKIINKAQWNLRKSTNKKDAQKSKMSILL